MQQIETLRSLYKIEQKLQDKYVAFMTFSVSIFFN